MYNAIVLIDNTSPLDAEVVVPKTSLADWEAISVGTSMSPVQLAAGEYQIKAEETSEAPGSGRQYRVKGAYLIDDIPNDKLGTASGLIKVMLANEEEVRKLFNDCGNAIVTVAGVNGTLNLSACSEDIHARGLDEASVSKRVRPALARADATVNFRNL